MIAGYPHAQIRRTRENKIHRRPRVKPLIIGPCTSTMKGPGRRTSPTCTAPERGLSAEIVRGRTMRKFATTHPPHSARSWRRHSHHLLNDRELSGRSSMPCMAGRAGCWSVRCVYCWPRKGCWASVRRFVEWSTSMVTNSAKKKMSPGGPHSESIPIPMSRPCFIVRPHVFISEPMPGSDAPPLGSGGSLHWGPCIGGDIAGVVHLSAISPMPSPCRNFVENRLIRLSRPFTGSGRGPDRRKIGLTSSFNHGGRRRHPSERCQTGAAEVALEGESGSNPLEAASSPRARCSEEQFAGQRQAFPYRKASGLSGFASVGPGKDRLRRPWPTEQSRWRRDATSACQSG